MRKRAAIGVFILIATAAGSFPTARRQVQIERVPEPLVLSLEATNVELTSQEDGVDFDLDADGTPERVAWTIAGRQDAFLAVDENHNGQIDDGSELVGAGISGPPNGFDYLNAYDGWTTRPSRGSRKSQAKGFIGRGDFIFNHLILWTDLNHNGISEEDELQSLAYAQVTELGISSRQRLNLPNGRGSTVREASAFVIRNQARNIHAVRLAGARMPHHEGR